MQTLSRLVGLPERVAVTAGRAFAIALRAVRALAHRRAVKRLADLDDRMLKDIGLTRGEVHGALASPLFADPSAHLAGLSHARQRRQIAEGLPFEGGGHRPALVVIAGNSSTPGRSLVPQVGGAPKAA